MVNFICNSFKISFGFIKSALRSILLRFNHSFLQLTPVPRFLLCILPSVSSVPIIPPNLILSNP